jgi:DNA-binding transcriptional regulator GbsR (MarR family)
MDDETTTKETRSEYPSGWLALVKNESVGYIIDALMDLPPQREFNQTELAEMAGVSRNSVGAHLQLLEELDLITEVEHTSPTRYRFNSTSEVSQALIQLEGAVNSTLVDDRTEAPA